MFTTLLVVIAVVGISIPPSVDGRYMCPGDKWPRGMTMSTGVDNCRRARRIGLCRNPWIGESICPWTCGHCGNGRSGPINIPPYSQVGPMLKEEVMDEDTEVESRWRPSIREYRCAPHGYCSRNCPAGVYVYRKCMNGNPCCARRGWH